MKFLCEQCKAKYQISDDKVAGKTVRMKCRKCGHMIEVRAEVTETSVSRGMPKESNAAPAAASPAGTAGPAGAAGGVKTPPPRGSSPRPPTAADSGHGSNSTGSGSSGNKGGSPFATSMAARKPQAPQAPRTFITPPPTPAVSGSSAESTVIGPPPSLNSGHSAGPGALAGAFQKSIAKDDPALRDITGLKEWYVAINGVPVGPVRVAELRRKASLGAVSEDSLVWQEGMEEWRPVKAYSELLALVREAAQSGRPPLAVTGDVRQSTPPPPGKGAYVPRGAVAMNRAPQPPTGDTFRGRSNVLPFAPRNAAAEKLEDPEATEVAVSQLQPSQTIQTPAPPDVMDPFGVPTIGGGGGVKAQEDPFRGGVLGASRPPLSVQISPASGNVVSPFAAGSVGSSSLPSAAPNFASNVGDRSSVSLGPPMVATEPPPPPKKGVPWIPLAMLALATAFGITAAIVIFRQPAPAPAPAPVVANSTPPPVVPSAPPPAASTEFELPDTPAASGSADKPPPGKVAAATPKAATSASSGKGTADLSELLKGTGSGPSTGSAGGSSSSGGGSLSEDQIRSVLNQHSLGVRRNCWERGSAGQQSSVNVTVHMVINGSGQVNSATSEGNDPAIAKCIETSVRSWTFPATGGTSTVNIPFKFVRQ